MKFTKLRLKGLSTVDLPIKNTTTNDSFVLKAADGLGPPEIDVFVAKTRDLGGYYKGRQTQYREPVLRVGLNPNYKTNVMVHDLRSILYGLLTPNISDQIELVVVNETDELMYTECYIKKMEIVPFNVIPEVQITMSCLETYFKALNPVYVEVPIGTSFQVTNQGTAETGLYFSITITNDLAWLTLTDSRGNAIKINFRFKANDILQVDTRPGSRAINVIRGGISYNAIYALTVDSTWIKLYGGTNTFTFSSADYIWNDFYYVPHYWGV